MSKRKRIDPREFGLHHSTILDQTGDNTFVIVMNRKSRIIMKDGNAILQKIEKIRKTYPIARVSVETNAPICSKTKAFLADKKITLIEV
ncbi:MAG: hypothetical protein MJE63_17085 [Proteobacteria bacterium]|nr:hypothetical protein [Pseudomonadota bacterium]